MIILSQLIQSHQCLTRSARMLLMPQRAQTDVKTALWALSTIIFLIVIFVVMGMNHTGRKENDHEI